MKILAVGNVFESYSLLVDNFCPIDSEIVAKNLNSRISGAAIVVTAMAAFLGESAFCITKGAMTTTLSNYLDLLKWRNIQTTVLPASNSNTLITVYNQNYSRKCYSFIPNSIDSTDLESIDFSGYDLVFFCCLPLISFKELFENNRTIQSTCSVVLTSGLATSFFEGGQYLLNSNYLFINRGELTNIFAIKDEDSLFTEGLVKRLKMSGTNIIVTQGRKGIIGIVDDYYFEHPVHEITSIVHPGGAGDSFAVGFMISLIAGRSISESCDVGHQCASKMLSVYNIEEFLRGNNDIIW